MALLATAIFADMCDLVNAIADRPAKRWAPR